MRTLAVTPENHWVHGNNETKWCMSLWCRQQNICSRQVCLLSTSIHRTQLMLMTQLTCSWRADSPEVQSRFVSVASTAKALFCVTNTGGYHSEHHVNFAFTTIWPCTSNNYVWISMLIALAMTSHAILRILSWTEDKELVNAYVLLPIHCSDAEQRNI